MSKRVFELKVKEESEIKTLSEQATNSFKEFVEAEIPQETRCYDWKQDELLIEIFSYDTEPEIEIVGKELSTAIVYLPLARVIASGSEEYPVGSIVKLFDAEVSTVENPEYQKWKKNALSKSNMKQKGQEPQRFMSTVVKHFSGNLFKLNPFRDSSEEDRLFFKVSRRRIQNKINDVGFLIDNV